MFSNFMMWIISHICILNTCILEKVSSFTISSWIWSKFFDLEAEARVVSLGRMERLAFSTQELIKVMWISVPEVTCKKEKKIMLFCSPLFFYGMFHWCNTHYNVTFYSNILLLFKVYIYISSYICPDGHLDKYLNIILIVGVGASKYC